MSTRPIRWEVKCNKSAGFRGCQREPVIIDASSLSRVRSTLRERGWHCGTWKEWAGRDQIDLCPTCVAYVKRELKTETERR